MCFLFIIPCYPIFLLLQPEDLATTTSILYQYKCSVDVVIDETMMESRRCILLPKYDVVFVLPGIIRLSFFVVTAVQEEMFIQFHT